MMDLCTKHQDALEMALQLRGLLRPSLTSDIDLTPLNRAKDLIGIHATNFAGRATIEMIQTNACPLCFINRYNPAHENLDDWVHLAAQEVADAHSKSVSLHHT